jgi:gliding motility-associated lipoprotein GldD
MRTRLEPLLCAVALLVGCGEDPVPKPRGYFRIDLPEQTYQPWDSGHGLRAEMPTAARVAERKAEGDARWFDVRYKSLRATVHLTWSPVNGQMASLIEDAHVFKGTHGVKARRIGHERVLRDSARVFGTIFDVDGDVASPMVFYLTDSTDNFLYGALYFDARPNADSLAPVTERIRADMRHMAATLQWR